MKIYETPQLIPIMYQAKDVITASTDPYRTDTGDWDILEA